VRLHDRDGVAVRAGAEGLDLGTCRGRHCQGQHRDEKGEGSAEVHVTNHRVVRLQLQESFRTAVIPLVARYPPVHARRLRCRAVTILQGPRVVLRPAGSDDIPTLEAIRREPSVERWWGVLEEGELATDLRDAAGRIFAIELDGRVIGGIQWWQD